MEQRSFYFEGHTIPYSLERGRRKHAYLTLTPEGDCILKVPLAAKEEWISSLLQQKAPWILSKMEQCMKDYKPPLAFQAGEVLPVWGDACKLNICLPSHGKTQVVRSGEELSVFLDAPTPAAVKQAVKTFYLEETQRTAKELLRFWEAKTGCSATSLKVKWMKRSWGRCRSSGDISIHALLSAYPVECLSYVVLHEVCHLNHMNHSTAFWEMVAFYMPDYKNCKNLLKNSLGYLQF